MLSASCVAVFVGLVSYCPTYFYLPYLTLTDLCQLCFRRTNQITMDLMPRRSDVTVC